MNTTRSAPASTLIMSSNWPSLTVPFVPMCTTTSSPSDPAAFSRVTTLMAAGNWRLTEALRLSRFGPSASTTARFAPSITESPTAVTRVTGGGATRGAGGGPGAGEAGAVVGVVVVEGGPVTTTDACEMPGGAG